MNPGRLGIAAHSPATVLVVDDDPIVLKVTTEMITRAGLTVVVANNGKEALDSLLAQSVDAVVCDMRMPRYDGEWLLLQMRAHKLSTPVVIATGLDELDASLSLGPGVVGYVRKPYQFAELRAALDAAIPTFA